MHLATADLQTAEILNLIDEAFTPSGVVPSSELASEFKRRVSESADKVRTVATWVGQYFEKEFRTKPLPHGTRLAVFAAGSASRLEMYGQLKAERDHDRARAAKEGNSDVDVLCVVDGWKDGKRRRKRKVALICGLAHYLETKDNKSPTPGCPIGFDCVWLDSMSKLPYAAFRTTELLIGRRDQTPDLNLRRLRTEDRRIETWRYWIVFESILLYWYPEQQGLDFATGLEGALARDYFGIDSAIESKHFPLLWYHAACRYMSEIYLADLRYVAAINDTRKMMKKAVKLKSARVLMWSLALTNAVLIHQFTNLGLSESDLTKCRRLAAAPGLIRSIKLMKHLRDRLKVLGEIAAGGGMNSEAKAVQVMEEAEAQLKEAERELGPVLSRLVDAYEQYFRWLEGGGNAASPVSRDDVLDFLQGRPTNKIPVTKDIVELVHAASQLFRKLCLECEARTGFVPDFLY